MPIEFHNVSELMRTGVINLHLETARKVGTTASEDWGNASGGVTSAAAQMPGGMLSSLGTGPSLKLFSTALRQPYINWTSAVLTPVQFQAQIVPPDWSTQFSSVTFHILAGRDAAASSDTGTLWTVKWYNSTGTSNSTTMAVTNITSSVATEYSVAMLASRTPSHPGVLTVTLAPLSTADQPKLHAAWIEYYRAPRG